MNNNQYQHKNNFNQFNNQYENMSTNFQYNNSNYQTMDNNCIQKKSDLPSARYFIIKSVDEDNIHKVKNL